MKQSPSRSATTKRSLIEKPALAVVALADGPAPHVEPDIEAAREARVRAAAYALYEARGHQHGHDLDDWLAAEKAEARLAGPEPAGPAPTTTH